MDHALRTISYIADIGDVLVIMARRGPVTSPSPDGSLRRKRQSKICCHVFDTDEVGDHRNISYTIDVLSVKNVTDTARALSLSFVLVTCLCHKSH